MSKYIYTVWRRKTASAQVKLFEWAWKDMINWKLITEYVNRSDLFEVLFKSFVLTKTKWKFHFEVVVKWSWISAQVQAISHALAKALVEKDSSFKKILKEKGLLTRDARIVERKKPGKHKARKSPQWSKR